MYNLFVSYQTDTWDGDPLFIEESRCVSTREYTDEELTRRFGGIDAEAVEELRRYPCIFAYESIHNLPPKFGLIRQVTRRQQGVRVEYEIKPSESFLAATDFDRLAFELDVGRGEMNRTHWAVKDVDLQQELQRHRITLPDWMTSGSVPVDISSHHFKVGLSFPGESRSFVKDVANGLEGHLGSHTYFYDNNYVSQLARPSLDSLLQDIYRNRCDLVVVFVGEDYQEKDWCGVEWRAIRDIIYGREHSRVMYVRMDDGDVEGVFRGDGYVDARQYRASDVTNFILERIALIEAQRS